MLIVPTTTSTPSQTVMYDPWTTSWTIQSLSNSHRNNRWAIKSNRAATSNSMKIGRKSSPPYIWIRCQTRYQILKIGRGSAEGSLSQGCWARPTQNSTRIRGCMVLRNQPQVYAVRTLLANTDKTTFQNETEEAVNIRRGQKSVVIHTSRTMLSRDIRTNYPSWRTQAIVKPSWENSVHRARIS